MLFPIIPETSKKVLKIFGLKENDIVFNSISDHNYLKSVKNINKISILFKKIEKQND